MAILRSASECLHTSGLKRIPLKLYEAGVLRTSATVEPDLGFS